MFYLFFPFFFWGFVWSGRGKFCWTGRSGGTWKSLRTNEQTPDRPTHNHPILEPSRFLLLDWEVRGNLEFGEKATYVARSRAHLLVKIFLTDSFAPNSTSACSPFKFKLFCIITLLHKNIFSVFTHFCNHNLVFRFLCTFNFLQYCFFSSQSR